MTTFDPQDPLVRRLLQAGREDIPSEHAVNRALVAVAAAVASAGVATTAAAGPAAGAGIAASAKHAGASMGWLAFAKWTGVGLSAGIMTIGVFEGASQYAAPDPERDAVIHVAEPKPAPVLAASRPRLTELEAIASDSPAPTAASKAPIPSGGRESDPLGREVSLLDTARSALDRGSPAKALDAIRRYEGEYPQGRLLPEALVLRMRALEQLGDRTGARDAARRILEISPASPHAARARVVLETP